MRKINLFIVFFLTLLGGITQVNADDLTVYDGTATNNYLPMYGYYADTKGTISEYIIPASDLSALNGLTIEKMVFYLSSPAAASFGSASFNVYLEEVSGSNYDDSSASQLTDSKQLVYAGALDATGTTMEISFTTNYTYNGGNLLVAIEVGTAGTYKAATFYGTTTTSYSGRCSQLSSSSRRQKFIPKTTFCTPADGPALTVKDGNTKLSSPYSYNFGLATPGTTKAFTLSNPGTETATVSVSHTGTFGAELSSTSIPAGETATLTVTMPDATGSDVITISSTDEGIDDFVINVSGVVRDPNKMFVDFAGGVKPDDWTSVGNSYSWTFAEDATGKGYAGYNGTSSSYYGTLTSPKMVFEDGETLLFSTAKYSSSTWYSPSISIEVSTDGNSWTTVNTFTDDVSGTWTLRSVTIPATTQYIRFRGWYIYITDIYGGKLSTIVEPKALAASNITVNSADLSWTSAATSFNIQYKAEGDADWTTINGVTANPYTLTGLAATTTYQAKVQADFGAEGLSDYTDAITFTTSVAPITEYPYTENFNSLTTNGEIPAYWDNSEGSTTTATNKWSYNTSYGTGHEGKCVRFDSYNNYSGNTNFLKTRPFSFTEGQPMKLTFWYKNPAGGDFSVYISTDGGATYPTELATGLTGKSDWTEKEIDIPASVYGDNVVIVFKGTSNYGSGDARIYLDDVTVSEKLDYAMSITGDDVNENTIAFGTVKNTTTTKTFTIKNDGGNALTGVSVVSSDAEVFTVSDIGFDIAVGETKDITVTFVKGVDGDYNENITVSQADVATPLTLTVTGTYVSPTPATMDVTLDATAVGETVAFGKVGRATTKTFTVANAGETTLSATIAKSGTNADCFTLSANSIEVSGGASETFTITFDAEEYDVEKTATITMTAGELSKQFTVTGTRGDFWIEDFEGGSMSTGWVATNWTVGTNASYDNTTYMALAPSSSTTGTLVTPRLLANKDDILRWDAYFQWADEELTIEYSNDDKQTWTTVGTVYGTETGEKGSGRVWYHKNLSFTAPADGYYYLRFTARYSNGVDNFEGFKLAMKEHDVSITSQNIRSTFNQYGTYDVSVTVQELLGKEETLTAKFFIGDTQYGESVTETVEANGTKTFTISVTLEDIISGDAYFTITNENIDLKSEKVAVITKAAIVLDETTETDLSDISTSAYQDVVCLKYTAKQGWNTICVPFKLTSTELTAIFGEGYKAYEFKGNINGELKFSVPSSFVAGYPYIIHSTNPATFDDKGYVMKVLQLTTTTAKYDGSETTGKFQGTFAPIAAPGMEGKYGVVPSTGRIQKGGANASLKGYRAYFELPADATASEYTLTFYNEDGTVTSIKGLDILDSENGDIYDLSGRKINKLNKAGVYIQNGKKIVVK